ncbi:tRNA wybutosine-synthesizing protein 2-like protein [Dinothrombium tinctorium]|uniref:tRNA(Phe) (4-demethylwyosine(37)-C(7)) aminocarboxypropyltransferase n=1 Tax=Dinothrombium tinctorium TaxID=1965070 RepID=A0A3S3P7D3_9ACAR|nr:tRNA wybutosine-synthesizing protein 2-like protein [Dinothrombium tinctorium]RWS09502.1 tRNA wybutosine-synthesizing protein 2-like protein [Dinothrombium tinctorium]RWS09528.1 tRNA wybutosine-synthesizing protein 2-like protein [Dinothrombium tinctorium]RWS09799.1 tRNA wybutosine-synthesizing protein 2-like protein [Dinothrombium tinctorium]
MIKGDDSWALHIDNKIKYTFDITKCMFSFGNINEKIRVSKLNCENEIIVDLFCGIGYFTLPFLVHSKAKFVHAIDWNPDAIEALNKNLILNGVSERCKTYVGDNRLVCPKDIADRVYLGLIPTSKNSWQTACAALKQRSGGILHIHENVNSFGVKGKDSILNLWNQWALHVLDELKSLFHRINSSIEWSLHIREINKVKSYAPHINHMVIDVECQPNIHLDS